MGVSSACMPVKHMNAEPGEFRRRHQIPWNWRWLWAAMSVLGLEPGTARTGVLSAVEPLLAWMN